MYSAVNIEKLHHTAVSPQHYRRAMATALRNWASMPNLSVFTRKKYRAIAKLRRISSIEEIDPYSCPDGHVLIAVHSFSAYTAFERFPKCRPDLGDCEYRYGRIVTFSSTHSFTCHHFLYVKKEE